MYLYHLDLIPHNAEAGVAVPNIVMFVSSLVYVMEH